MRLIIFIPATWLRRLRRTFIEMSKLICLVVVVFFIHRISCEYDVPTTEEEIEKARAAMYASGNFGGDMMLNAGQKAALKTRNAWPDFAKKWPGGIIPYVIDASIADKATYIYQAAAHIKNMTGNCIQFVPRTNQNDYVWMIYGNKGCWSWIGRQGGRQDLHLGDGCGWFGLAVHEMLHAVGFAHEQNRPDRDQFLTIYPQNIQQGQGYNFEILRNGITYNAFDYNSIMLYGEQSFTNRQGYKTMEAKDKRFTITDPWTKKNGMTQSDAYEVKRYYQCR